MLSKGYVEQVNLSPSTLQFLLSFLPTFLFSFLFFIYSLFPSFISLPATFTLCVGQVFLANNHFSNAKHIQMFSELC